MKTSEAVAIIHRGIFREKDAISAYIKFAKAVKDPKAKNVLINLADDEVGHLNKLEKHLMNILKNKPWLYPKADEIEAVAAVFSSSAYPEKEIREKDLVEVDEIKILNLAVDREIIANRYYLDLAAMTESPEAKEMFLALAKEEELHMKILKAEIDSIGQSGFWFDIQEFTMEQEGSGIAYSASFPTGSIRKPGCSRPRRSTANEFPACTLRRSWKGAGGGPCTDPRGKPVTGEAGRFDRHPGGIYTDPTAGRRLSGR